MGILPGISSQFLPLIYVKNWFPCIILNIILSILFKVCKIIDIGKKCYRITYRLILSKTTVMAVELKIRGLFKYECK